MIIPDANVLLYAHIPFFKQHLDCRLWLENCISDGREIIGLPWQVITAFVRVGTNRRIFEIPLSIDEAEEKINLLLQNSLVEIVLPTDKHWRIFSKILKEEQIAGDLVMDAHLAAMGIEHNASVATTDRDFARFSNLKTINPLKK